jgi:PAS domain S-box-containing protein
MKTAAISGPEAMGRLKAEVRRLELANRDLVQNGAMHERTQEALVASEVRYRRLFESAKDGILILDAEDGRVVDVNPFLIDLLHYSRDEFLGKKIWELGFFRDIVANRESFAELQQQEYIRYDDKPLETAAGRRIDVEFVSNVYLVNRHRVIQCNIRDISKRKLTEHALQSLLDEKVVLLHEVHHRVKNNLQIIMSLLRMEARKSLEPATKMVVKEMLGRIRSMAVLHETIYRTGEFARVDLAPYLRQLATQLFRAQNEQLGAVALVLELAMVEVDVDQAIPCGLIVNELATNSLKHGFPDGRRGEVRIGLHRAGDGQVQLQVSDTGVGFSDSFDGRNSNSLGLHLVEDLTRQLRGTLQVGPGAARMLSFVPGSGAGHPNGNGTGGSTAAANGSNGALALGIH